MTSFGGPFSRPISQAPRNRRDCSGRMANARTEPLWFLGSTANTWLGTPPWFTLVLLPTFRRRYLQPSKLPLTNRRSMPGCLLPTYSCRSHWRPWAVLILLALSSSLSWADSLQPFQATLAMAFFSSSVSRFAYKNIMLLLSDPLSLSTRTRPDFSALASFLLLLLFFNPEGSSVPWCKKNNNESVR